jgi:hypothetical protein
MAMLLFVESMLWSIIGDVGFVVSSVVLATQALLSFHILTGKMETRPVRGHSDRPGVEGVSEVLMYYPLREVETTRTFFLH